MLECSVYGRIYKDSAPHYCNDCGKNLTPYIEKTDVILIFSKSFKVIGLIGAVIFTYLLASCVLIFFVLMVRVSEVIILF